MKCCRTGLGSSRRSGDVTPDKSLSHRVTYRGPLRRDRSVRLRPIRPAPREALWCHRFGDTTCPYAVSGYCTGGCDLCAQPRRGLARRWGRPVHEAAVAWTHRSQLSRSDYAGVVTPTCGGFLLDPVGGGTSSRGSKVRRQIQPNRHGEEQDRHEHGPGTLALHHDGEQTGNASEGNAQEYGEVECLLRQLKVRLLLRRRHHHEVVEQDQHKGYHEQPR